MIIPYRCKFCKTERVATFDGDNPDVVYKMEVWKSMLACNACADYRMDRRKYIDAIRRACESISRSGVIATKDQIERAREVLVNVTKKLSGIVCAHYGLTNVWDIEFVLMLIDSPDKWLPVVNKYIKGIAQMKQRPAAE